jgi:cytoskeleton-associated protein 5
VGKAIKCLALLAQGLRKDFAAGSKQVVAVLLEKFKEKKSTVVEAIHEALDNMYWNCFTLPDVIEGIDCLQHF